MSRTTMDMRWRRTTSTSSPCCATECAESAGTTRDARSSRSSSLKTPEREHAPRPRASELEEQLSIRFRQPDLLRDSLTHRSYAFEHGGVANNERLEFLGDAVLGLVVTDMIFSQFPHLPEGEMAKLRAATVNMGVLRSEEHTSELQSPM